MIDVQANQPHRLLPFLMYEIPLSLARYLIPHPDFEWSKQPKLNNPIVVNFSALTLFKLAIFPDGCLYIRSMNSIFCSLVLKIDLFFNRFSQVFLDIRNFFIHVHKPSSLTKKNNLRIHALPFLIKKCFGDIKNLHQVRKMLLIPNFLINKKILGIYFTHLAYPVINL